MFARRGFSALSKMAQASILGTSKLVPQTSNVRLFSQTFPRHSAVTKELVDTLKQEIDEEKRLQSESKATKPTITGFEIKTKGAEVTLTKKQGNETLKIVFDVSHSVDPDNDEFEEGDDELGAPAARPPLDLQIIKGDKKLCFDMDIVGGEDEGLDYTIQEFYLANASEEKVPEHVYRSSGGYIDPALGDLLFKQYLEERGITSDLLKQIVDFATHHEHQEYVKLLEGLKNFADSK